ncbi:helix-turn-helix domain-containing protein [Diplocloster modestus]|uniref:Helix-turn-helix domain-containing protein n=1 Tax=Diplocloster modestus TaxID=2850322 RepID=A0ABS6KD95_9FIRM|nr:helix-turn-helix transcriptional regulator [Diplocloster modestus]MBU9728491.1 helix-turn-helix domain-containing protein [Diplocloster modestus]
MSAKVDLEDRKNVGANIQRIRLEHGLTQEKLAEAIGISSSYMSSIETGRKYPSSNILYAIRSYFGVPMSQIMGVGDEETDNEKEELKELDFYDRQLLRMMKYFSMAQKKIICETIEFLKDKI